MVAFLSGYLKADFPAYRHGMDYTVNSTIFTKTNLYE